MVARETMGQSGNQCVEAILNIYSSSVLAKEKDAENSEGRGL